MTLIEKQFSFIRGTLANRWRGNSPISAISILLVLWAVAGAARANAAARETELPKKTQRGASLEQILDAVTKSELNPDGLDQSNLAIDQIVQRANKLIKKANKVRAKEITGTNAYTPLGQVMGQASLTLSDADSYLLKLKELQSAVLAARGHTGESKVDARETCKDLNVKFKAIWTDLKNLKLGVKTLPLRQRAIADVMLWDMEPKLISAIHKIRQRTLQIGSALTLESELELKAG
jgi:hypothetical protein